MLKCKVWSATKSRDREALGDKVTAWLHQKGEVEVQAHHVLQSSDDEYHCLSIVLFYREK